ncbi:DUF4418 family protein [Schaalia sp. 19OD2882]|uniref:DUF4418 family protein n=1 Tax=Schaalia sp. 19OD2882 TaxID=2794089 RepID=UPI001C1EDD4F|nr:DUF4418 family protein [Schaalia sp. 19OD2882]QWW19838.1 DUF4418 family protein [Schaalia sp. 19OD2882]
MSTKKLAVALTPAVLALLLSLGAATVFSACDRREDGTWMHCHQCQNSVVGAGLALAVVFGASTALKHRIVRLALQALALVLTVVVFFIPGTLCPMCMMKTMRCYTVFQPFTRVMSGLIALTGVGAAVIAWKDRQCVAA